MGAAVPPDAGRAGVEPPGPVSSTGHVEKEMAMLIRNRRLFLPLAVLSLILSVLLHRIGAGIIPRSAFFEGLFLGLATALTVVGLFTARSD
jgi:hypothetical protein